MLGATACIPFHLCSSHTTTHTYTHHTTHSLNSYLYVFRLDEPGFVCEDGDDLTQVAQFLRRVVKSSQPLRIAPLQ